MDYIHHFSDVISSYMRAVLIVGAFRRVDKEPDGRK